MSNQALGNHTGWAAAMMLGFTAACLVALLVTVMERTVEPEMEQPSLTVNTRVPVFLVQAPVLPKLVGLVPPRVRVASAVWVPVRPVMVTGWLVGRAPVGWMVTVMVLEAPLVRVDSWITAVVQVLVPPRTAPVRVVAFILGVAERAEMVGTAASLPVAGFFRVKVTVEVAVEAMMALVVRTRVPVVPGVDAVASEVQEPVVANPVPVVVRVVVVVVNEFLRLVIVTVAPEARGMDGRSDRVIRLSALPVWLASLMLLTNQQPPPAPSTQSVNTTEVEAWGLADEMVGLTPPVLDSAARFWRVMVKTLSEEGISVAVVSSSWPVFLVQAPVFPKTAEAAPAT
mmetsp:Transcript_14464/g.33739  ORF Transcript_14464/g.33739 Transcript_14464/m.33739 type:complete len:342 (-) Transcript_14464:264-1289(-)